VERFAAKKQPAPAALPEPRPMEAD